MSDHNYLINPIECCPQCGSPLGAARTIMNCMEFCSVTCATLHCPQPQPEEVKPCAAPVTNPGPEQSNPTAPSTRSTRDAAPQGSEPPAGAAVCPTCGNGYTYHNCADLFHAPWKTNPPGENCPACHGYTDDCPVCLGAASRGEYQRVETPAAEPAETNASVIGSCAGSSPASLPPQPQGGTPEVDAEWDRLKAAHLPEHFSQQRAPHWYRVAANLKEFADSLERQRNEARAALAAAQAEVERLMPLAYETRPGLKSSDDPGVTWGEAEQNALRKLYATQDELEQTRRELEASRELAGRLTAELRIARESHARIAEELRASLTAAEQRAEGAEAKLPANLAQRCFDEDRATDELFKTINAIMGGRPLEECASPGYKWAATDTWVDDYDQSVEIIRGPEQPELTQEQATAILDLGFACIYESPADADTNSRDGFLWTRNGRSWCMPRKRDDENVRLVKATAQRDTAIRERDALSASFLDAEAKRVIEMQKRKEVQRERDEAVAALKIARDFIAYNAPDAHHTLHELNEAIPALAAKTPEGGERNL